MAASNGISNAGVDRKSLLKLSAEGEILRDVLHNPFAVKNQK